MSSSNFTRYIYQDRSGRIVDSRDSHELLGLGHTAFLPPWSDPDIHFHVESEELYLLRHGELDLYIAGTFLTLQPDELLIVRPGVPHAVAGGRGEIEYFGIRAPFREDKQPIGKVPAPVTTAADPERAVQSDWGCRIPLTAPENQNCWLIGWGAAKHPSRHLILAYLSFPSSDSANAGIGMRLRMHYHRTAWEYYTVLKGRKVLQIEDDLVEVGPGEILEVPPGVRHNIHHREAPYEGFTIRVPVTGDDDKVEDPR